VAYKQLAQEIAQRGVAGWENSAVGSNDADDAQEA